MSEEILFSYCRTVLSVVPVFKDVGERSTAKNCNPGSLLSKVRNVTFFLIASMDFGLLDQLWIFGHCMIELPGLLINRSGDTGALDVANAFFLTRFGMLVVFTNLRLMEFQVSYLVLFCSFFSVVDGYKLFWMESLHRNVQSMLEFLKAPFLVVHFFLPYINDFPDDLICNIGIFADDTAFYSK